MRVYLWCALFAPPLILVILIIVLLSLPSPPTETTIRYGIPDGGVLTYEVESRVEQERIRGGSHDRLRTEAKTDVMFGYYTEDETPKTALMFYQRSLKLLRFLRNGHDITDGLRGSVEERIPPEFFFLNRSKKTGLLSTRINDIDTGSILLALYCKPIPKGRLKKGKTVKGRLDFGRINMVYEWKLKGSYREEGRDVAILSFFALISTTEGSELGFLQAQLSVEPATTIILEDEGELVLNIEEKRSGKPEQVIYRRQYKMRLIKEEWLDPEKLSVQMKEVEDSYVAHKNDRPIELLEHLRKASEAYSDSPFSPYINARLDTAIKKVKALWEELLSEELEKELKKLLTCPHCGKIHNPNEHNHKK